METKRLFIALFSCIIALQTVQAQSEKFFDGTDFTLLNDNDLLPKAAAKKVMAIYDANEHLFPDMEVYRDMPKTTSLPSNFEDIYFENNWLEVSSYWYMDDLEENRDTHGYLDGFLWVTSRDKGTAELQYRHRIIPGRPDPEIAYYNNFDGNIERIKKVGNYYYRHTNYKGKSEENYSVIVSYNNGILILENSYTGKVGDFTSKRRFRNVYLAIPKNMVTAQPVSLTSTPTVAATQTTTVSTSNSNYVDGIPVQPVLTFPENCFINGMSANNLRDNFFLRLPDFPTAEALKSMRPGKPITPALEYDLYDYDWLEVARYEWYNGERYIFNSLSSDMVRFHPQAGTYQFTMQHPGESMDATLKYLNNWEKHPTTVSRQGVYTYLSLNGQPARTVVNYEENLLVIDEKDPVSGSTFRMVYLAVPKQF